MRSALCPTSARLEQLLLGSLSEEDSIQLEQHLSSCPECARSAKSLSATDGFIDLIKAQHDAVDQSSSPGVIALVQRLQQLRPELNLETMNADSPVPAPAPPIVLSEEMTAEIPVVLREPGASGEISKLGNYRVLRALGTGGMGIVFEAEDVTLRRRVALKVMKASLAASAAQRQRFLNEARAMAQIKDARVVTVYEVNEEAKVPYLAMELLEGEPLDARLAREGTMPVADAVRIGRQIAQGLAAAHARGLIHRDVKPANVWLESSGDRVVLLDFGLARAAGDESHLTATGTLVGTPAYVAPEQARGEEIDERADLFSLGCVLYRMCTGIQPFGRTSVTSTLLAVLNETPKPVSQHNPTVPPALSQLIERMLSKAAKDRTATAREADQLLAQIEEQSAPKQELTTLLPSIPARRPPNRLAGILVAAALLGFVALAAAGVVFFLPTSDGKGTIRVEIDDPQIKVTVTKNGMTFEGADKHEIRIEPGAQTLKVKRGDLEFETDSFVLKKGDTVRLSVVYLDGKLQAVTKEGKVIGWKDTPKVVQQPVKDEPAWKPTAEQQKFIDAVSKLQPGDRTNAVARKLQELNAPWSKSILNSIAFEPKEGAPTKCRLNTHEAFHLWPLAALTSLTSLDLSGAGAIDFTPLAGLPLVELKCDLILDNVTSEKALASMKTLKTINGKPAADSWSERARIRKEVDEMAGVSDGLPVADRAKWLATTMKALHPGSGKRGPPRVEEKDKLLTVVVDDLAVFDVTPVRALSPQVLNLSSSVRDLTPLARTRLVQFSGTFSLGLRDLSPLAGLPLTQLHLRGSLVSDLRPLAGMKLTSFTCVQRKDYYVPTITTISDVSALKGMPLETLDLTGIWVSDLGPLAGMKLRELRCAGTAVIDVTPLKGMPLSVLEIGTPYKGHGRRVSDLSPLAGMKLKELNVKFRLDYGPDEKLLRSMPLEKLNGLAAAEFWKRYEERKKADRQFAEGVAKLSAEKAVEAVTAEVTRRSPLFNNKHALVSLGVCRIEEGAVVEAAIKASDPSNIVADARYSDICIPLRAFPKLRKLTVTCPANSEIDLSPLLDLPLEEFSGNLVEYNAPILRAMPKLKTINGKPAKEVLDAVANREAKK